MNVCVTLPVLVNVMLNVTLFPTVTVPGVTLQVLIAALITSSASLRSIELDTGLDSPVALFTLKYTVFVPSPDDNVNDGAVL